MVVVSIARTCSEAGKSAGNCISSSTSKECYVPGGQCYCDSVCTTYNDCCDDVNVSTLSYYYYGKFMMTPRGAFVTCIKLFFIYKKGLNSL